MDRILHDKLGLDRAAVLGHLRIDLQKVAGYLFAWGGYVAVAGRQVAFEPLYIVFARALCHKGRKICEKMQKIFKKGIDFIENFAIIG